MIAEAKDAGEKPSRRTTEPPTVSGARSEAKMPPTWNSGITLMATSDDLRPSAAPMTPALLTSAPIVSGTTLGWAVVPLVRSSPVFPDAGVPRPEAPVMPPPAAPPQVPGQVDGFNLRIEDMFTKII